MPMVVMVAAMAVLVMRITRIADARGRSAFGWAFLALGAGLIGMIAAVVVILGDSENPAPLVVLAAMLLTVVPPFAIALVLKRLPIKTSSRACWPVCEVAGRGSAGEISLIPGAIRIALEAEHAVPNAALRTVQADGECVRLAWEADGKLVSLVVMPSGAPRTPEGRKHHGRVMVRRIRQHLRAGSVGALPVARLIA